MARLAKSTNQAKRIPDMSDWSDEEIAEYWETHDSVEVADQMEDVDVEIEQSEDFRVISLRLETKDIQETKRLARAKGVPYTILLRMWIKEQLSKSRG